MIAKNQKSVKTGKVAKYAAQGVEFKAGKILAPEIGWINPLLVDGNSKLGKGVWTFSMLPSNRVFTVAINGRTYEIQGTCPCDCAGCYAQTGFYNMPSVILANAVKTYLSRNFLEWVKAAIIAQIRADGIQLLRIHASGDFFSDAYIAMWRDVVQACPGCVFWTYTKNKAAENAFDGLDNINIVKSVIPGAGFNFGRCDYILRVYSALKAAGKDVYICRCGIDKNQHCTTCKGCSRNKYVLFIEHSTGYKAEEDPAFPALAAIIESQAAQV